MKKNTAPKGIKIKMSREEIAYQIFIAVVVGLLVLCCLIPFLYVVGMSFTSEGEMIQRYPCGITDSVRIPLPSEIFRKGHVYGLCKGMSFPRKRELNGGLV